ncbi:MAG: hypothetical protein AXA67_03855 [Methylothermaceae bacteria B42]|nr:MAG: hypothetical protein AXA67_03855 [Methylothermaceae bacteria B42]HHJ38577.1 hypothetical protein [Methylothermaceae bacterium]
MNKILSIILLLFIMLWNDCIAMANEGDRLWPAEGVPVVTSSHEQDHARMISDGEGGTIIVWEDNRNKDIFGNDNWDIYAQRLDADGNILWGTNGTPIAQGADQQRLPEIASDGSGGAIIVWKTGANLYAQHIDANGNIQWHSGGVQISDNSSVDSFNPIAIAPDGMGGAFIAFETALGVRCVRVQKNGNLVAPGINGIALGGGAIAGGGPAIAGTAPGSVMVVMADGWCTRVQKVAADLSLPWGANPVNLSCDPRREARPDIVSDGSGGAFIAWVRQRHPVGDPAGNHVVAQHLDSNGNALWAPGGLILVDSSIVGGNDAAWRINELIPSITADGLGGAVVAWNDWRHESGLGGNDDIYAQSISEDGSLQWTSGGIPVWLYPQGSQRKPKVIGTREGGAMVVFQDHAGGDWDIIAVKLQPDGSRGFYTYVYDDMTSENPTDETFPQVVFDGSGPLPTGAIIGWIDERGFDEDIYAQKIELVLHKPDLIVDSIVFDPPVPSRFEPFTVVIRVKNQGDAATSGGFSVLLSGFGGLFGDGVCGISVNLGPTERASCSINFPDGKENGIYEVTANADRHPLAIYNNVIDESNENNNAKTVTLNIGTIVLPCEGNFDGDGDVDGRDLSIFNQNFGRTECNGLCQGDFDNDGDVDGSDLAVFNADFGRMDCPLSEF